MKKKLHSYESDAVEVEYDLARCIHAARCIDGLPEVFAPDRKPWVRPEEAEADVVAAVVCRCPTGALHYTRKDGGDPEPVPDENTVDVEADGPLYVRGDVVLKDPDGEVVLRDTRIALCRCGLSNNKPFCDNSHVDAFAAGAALGTTGTDEVGDASGTLTVTLSQDGPLVLHGPFRLEGDAEARTYEKGALCRCGHSGNKPFCDGTHRDVDFTSG